MKRFQHPIKIPRDAPAWADVALSRETVSWIAAKHDDTDMTDILDRLDAMAVAKAELASPHRRRGDGWRAG